LICLQKFLSQRRNFRWQPTEYSYVIQREALMTIAASAAKAYPTDSNCLFTENLDFGDLPVLIFGGCYSNLEATEALFREASRIGVPTERMICTGDVVAYGASPQETTDLIRAAGIPTIMGNCEESLGYSAADCGCGFSEGSACDQLSASWYAYADAHLNDDARAWMRSLPRRIDIIVGGKSLTVVHGAVDRINQFVFSSTEDAEFTRQFEISGADGIFAGHCGIPFTRNVSGKLWHNAGAIGMPANDGTQRTWFSLITPTASGLKIELMPLVYDAGAVADKMRRAGLPEGYSAALENGLWPSCDILPPAELAKRGQPLASEPYEWNPPNKLAASPLDAPPVKFSDPQITASGQPRAHVALERLETIWFNTGTLCNLTCKDCYIESSPRNDRLSYISAADVREKLDEAEALHPTLAEIGFTGGEPFMNPEIMQMLADALDRKFQALVLTNAMKPMQRHCDALLALHKSHSNLLRLRVSLDHYSQAGHEEIRGAGTWRPAIEGLRWLAYNRFDVTIAGRMLWNEPEKALRKQYQSSLDELQIELDAADPQKLVLFPEMGARADVPEITDSCWDILGKRPDSVMCATSRMVVKRKGRERASVVACTLLPYDERFELGTTLVEAAKSVALNHPYCAEFCVLGNASCSARLS